MTKTNAATSWLGYVILGVIIVGLIFFFSRNSSTKKNVEKKTVKQVTGTIESGTLILRKQNDRRIVVSGETFDMVLVLNAQKSSVAGFDAVVNFDPKVVGYVSTKNLVSEFENITTQSDGQIIVTGTGKDGNKTTNFKARPVLLLTFKTVGKGNSKIALLKEGEENKRDSNIFNEESRDILDTIETSPVLSGDKVTVGSKEIDAGDTKISITNLRLPDQGCVDCKTTIEMLVTRDADSSRLSFTTGGIAGSVHKAERAFGMTFEVEEASQNGVVVYFAKD